MILNGYKKYDMERLIEVAQKVCLRNDISERR